MQAVHRGRCAWDWLGLERVERNFSHSLIVIVDARIDRAVVHSGAPVVVLRFNRVVLIDVELPLPASLLFTTPILVNPHIFT